MVAMRGRGVGEACEGHAFSARVDEGRALERERSFGQRGRVCGIRVCVTGGEESIARLGVCALA